MPVSINDPLYLYHGMFNYMIKQIYNYLIQILLFDVYIY